LQVEKTLIFINGRQIQKINPSNRVMKYGLCKIQVLNTINAFIIEIVKIEKCNILGTSDFRDNIFGFAQ